MSKKPKQPLPTSFDQIPAILEIRDSDFPPAFFEKLPFVISGPGIDENVEAPIISVERHLGRSDIEKTVNFLKELRECPEDFSFFNICLTDAKEYHVKQDLCLLVDLVDRYFVHELKKIGVNPDCLPSDIIQIVEVEFTMIDLYPGDTEIHYQLYTKRGIGRRCVDEQ